MTTTRRRRAATNTTDQHHLYSSRLDLVATLVSLFGLYYFSSSFFLAKRSLPHTSSCDEAAELLQSSLGLTPQETQQLLLEHHDHEQQRQPQEGCWMNRRVDSMVMIVVDALRFDFALHHLPRSVGARLQNSTNSKLLQFVADPPTVTMQRLKALATGGLPTFADISNNMGGATVEEDTWLEQLKISDYKRRNLQYPSQVAFVGDDTWVDLFPKWLDQAYPYPSFNTRDLDTVDNGCLHHIPSLLDQLRTRSSTPRNRNTTTTTSKDLLLEAVIVHFLGVDHVGHTYGPHNQHMDMKLKQMDDALNQVLEFIDHSDDTCSVAFIFGDHGMTEDGNHGGGTEEEINAALFAHFSPACGIMTSFDGTEAATTEAAQTAFSSIHQIDLVPTLALLLGIPIPYANLGSLVPSLSLFSTASQTATALALNAAQVWRYFTMYSNTANPLPHLSDLEDRLQQAVSVWKTALSYGDKAHDSNAYHKACRLFKLFLAEALQLGQRVWTRFDTTGMTVGGIILGLGILLWCLPLVLMLILLLRVGGSNNNNNIGGGDNSMINLSGTTTITLHNRPPPLSQIWENGLTALLVIFQCGILTFGNSYILEEEHILMYMLGVLGVALYLRLSIITSLSTTTSSSTTSTATTSMSSTQPFTPRNMNNYTSLVIPVASRLGEFISGHGQDPSVRLHSAHHAGVFLSSLILLGLGRWYLYRVQYLPSQPHMAVDCVTLICLGQSWWEKRALDPERHGFGGSRIAIVMTLMGLIIAIRQAMQQSIHKSAGTSTATLADTITIIIKLLLLILIVTGPSAASSAFLFSAQAGAVYQLSNLSDPSISVSSPVLAAVWRFITRHVFFATNHGCTFSRLQLSAAFVATTSFNFYFAGASLFINTFGWEIVGLSFAWLLSSSSSDRPSGRPHLWRWYCLYQWIEMLCSCISVSVLKRHLMVWDIYAPHFLFVGIFTIIFSGFQLLVSGFGTANGSTGAKSESRKE